VAKIINKMAKKPIHKPEIALKNNYRDFNAPFESSFRGIELKRNNFEKKKFSRKNFGLLRFFWVDGENPYVP